MGKYNKYGLLRDNSLSDLSNPTKALANLLSKIQETYTPADIKSVIDDISSKSNPWASYLIQQLDNNFFANYSIPTDSTGNTLQPLLTVKNRLDIVKLICGEPAFYGGGGLTTDYFNWTSIYGNIVNTPTTFSLTSFENKAPAYSEVFWENGKFDYGYNIPMNVNLSETAGIIRYTGFFKPVQTSTQTFTIVATNSSYPETTGSVYIKMTDLDNVSVCEPVYHNTTATSLTFTTTAALQQYTYYKISIYFLRSPNQVSNNYQHSLKILLNSGGLPLYNLYSADYLSKQVGKINNYFKEKVLVGGTNNFTAGLSGDNNSVGGLLSSSYHSLVTTGNLYLDYKPPSNIYYCLAWAGLATGGTVTLVEGTNIVSSDQIYTNSITSGFGPPTETEIIQGYYSGVYVGNLVLSKQGRIPPLTYVKAIINDTTILLTNNVISSSNNDQLFFINTRGLKGYSQGYTLNTTTSSITLLSTFYGDERGYKPGDVVVTVDNLSGNSYYDGVFSNLTNYTQISSILPNNTFSLKKSFNWTGDLITSTYTPGFVLFYYKSGLSNNLSLRGYCSGGTVPIIASGKLSLSSAASTNTLAISGDILDYTGNKLSPLNLVSTNTALSVFEVNIGTGDSNLPFNTHVTSATFSSVTISQPLKLAQKSDTTTILFGLSTPLYNARDGLNNSRQSCFIPGDSIFPFVQVTTSPLNGIRTPVAPDGNLIFPNNSVRFNKLQYKTSVYDTNIGSIDENPATLSYTHTIPITGLDNSIFYLFAKEIIS